MKLLSLLAGCALMLTSIALSADADKDKKVSLEGIKCPVSGHACKPGTDVAYHGGRVYFCCTNCPKEFEKKLAESKEKKEPFKYATKANYQLAATGQAKEVKCPLTGQKLNPTTAIKVGDVEVAFCCDKCKGKVEKLKGNEQVNLVFGDKNFDKGFKVESKKAEGKVN